jgi:NCS1 family nucleobase:cation symporter-1
MATIIVSRPIICLFPCIIAWWGLTWHIGFTVQNRFKWGLRGAYIPLVQRSLQNFVWCAIQAWMEGDWYTYVFFHEKRYMTDTTAVFA